MNKMALCRLCGIIDNDTSGVLIFSEYGVKQSLAYKIKLALDIAVYDYDPLPKYICRTCLGKLFSTFAFKESCKKTQIKLTARFVQTENSELEAPSPQIVPNSVHSIQSDNAEILGTNGMGSVPNTFGCLDGQVALPQTHALPSSTVAMIGQPFEINTFLRTGIMNEVIGVNKKQTKRQYVNVMKLKNQNQNGPNGLENIPFQNSNPSVGGRSENVTQITNTFTSTSSNSQSPEFAPMIVSCASLQNTGPQYQQNEDTFICPEENTQVNSLPSKEEVNDIQIVDVFSVNDAPSASTPLPMPAVLNPPVTTTTYVLASPVSSVPTNIPFVTPSNSENRISWHSPTTDNLPPQPQSSNEPSPTTAVKEPDKNWHTPSESMPPSPETTSGESDKSEKTNDPLETSLDMTVEEEDEIIEVQYVNANKGSLAQYWVKSHAGYKCTECQKTFKKLIKCENHIRNHLGVKPFECSVCKHRFMKKRLLNEHSVIHTNIKIYTCKECPKSFRFRKNFKNHLQTHNALNENVSRSYLCEICRKTFSSQYEYWNHKTSRHLLYPNPGTVMLD